MTLEAKKVTIPTFLLPTMKVKRHIKTGGQDDNGKDLYTREEVTILNPIAWILYIAISNLIGVVFHI